MKAAIITTVSVIVLCIIGFLCYSLYNSQNQLKQKDDDLKSAAELIEFERQQTENELRELAIEIEGYSSTVSNDSLMKMLDTQKQKIQALLQELRTVKSTSARRISELKGELSTVRLVLVDYIRQVDSLNQINKGLLVENENVRQQYTQAAEEASQLAQEKVALSELVTRAAALEADVYDIQPINKKSKTNRARKVTRIDINFTLAKNVTAEPGEKTIYARIIKPNNEVLSKNPSNVFHYEDRNILYSIKRNIEYKGERMQSQLVWNVEETLIEGDYRVDLFAEGRFIGNGEFSLK